MNYRQVKFELDENQIKKLQKWEKQTKKKYGEYGHQTFYFSPTGIGDEVKVSNSFGEILDLTDVSKW